MTLEELQKTNRGLNRLRKYALLIASDHEARIAGLEAAAADDEGGTDA